MGHPARAARPRRLPTEWKFEVYIDLQRRCAREVPQRFANRASRSPLQIRAAFGSYDRARQLSQWAVGAPLADVMREVESVVHCGRRAPEDVQDGAAS